MTHLVDLGSQYTITKPNPLRANDCFQTRARNWQHQIYGNTQWNQGILLIHRKMFPEATNSTFHLKQNILTQLQPVQFRAASAFQNVIHSIH